MDTRKIIQALSYIVSKQKDKRIDNIKAYKLLWLTDRYHLRQYGRTVTGDTYYAMPKGVVSSDAKNLLEGKNTLLRKSNTNIDNVIERGIGYYKYKVAPNLRVFSKTDIEALDLILKNYNKMSAEELSSLSHNYPEWKRYEADLKNDNGKNSYKIDITLFFINHEDGKSLFMDDKEMLSLTRNIYIFHYGN